MQSTDPFINAIRRWIAVFMRSNIQKIILYAKDNGLSVPQIGALFLIEKKVGGVTDIGGDLGVTSAAASQMLERLVNQGFILRSEDPIDRRVKKIVLTDKGHHILQEIIHSRMDWLENLANTLSNAEKEQIAVGLNIMINKANQLEQPQDIIDSLKIPIKQ